MCRPKNALRLNKPRPRRMRVASKGSRSPADKQGFDFALHQTMDLVGGAQFKPLFPILARVCLCSLVPHPGQWYAHQGTTVYMLTKLPEGATRTLQYADSGWPTYERCSAEQIKKFTLDEAKWKLVLDLGENKLDAAGRVAQVANRPGLF